MVCLNLSGTAQESTCYSGIIIIALLSFLFFFVFNSHKCPGLDDEFMVIPLFQDSLHKKDFFTI